MFPRHAILGDPGADNVGRERMDIPFRELFCDFGFFFIPWMKYCIVLVFRRFPKNPVRKYLEHGSSGHTKGAFPGETGLLKMVPADVPNGKLCFISSPCFTFNTIYKFSLPYFWFACHFCIINDEYKFQNFAYHLYKQSLSNCCVSL